MRKEISGAEPFGAAAIGISLMTYGRQQVESCKRVSVVAYSVLITVRTTEIATQIQEQKL